MSTPLPRASVLECGGPKPPLSQPALHFDPLVSEMRKLSATSHELCPEAKLLLELAIQAQQTGTMPDMSVLK